MDFFWLFVIIGITAALEDYNTGFTKRAPLVFLFSVLVLHAFCKNPHVCNEKICGTFCTYLYFLVAKRTFSLLKVDKKEFIGQADILFCGSITALGGFFFFIATVTLAILLVLPSLVSEKFRSGKTSIPFIPALLFSTFIIFAVQIGQKL